MLLLTIFLYSHSEYSPLSSALRLPISSFSLSHKDRILFPFDSLNIFCRYFTKISLKVQTFSAHGEGGNSGGIDGRGKLEYNEFFSHERCNNLLYPSACSK